MKLLNSLRLISTLLLLLLLLSNSSFSQNRFGLLAGVGMSKEGNSAFSTYFKPAFELDGCYNIDYKDYLDFRIILGYKLRGFRDDNANSMGATDAGKAYYHLITFGPDFVFPLSKGKNKLYLVAGLRGNYLVAYSFTIEWITDYGALLDRLQLEVDTGIGLSFESGLFIEGIFSGNCLNKANKSKEPDLRVYDYYLGLATGFTF